MRHTEIESLNKHLFEQSLFGVDIQRSGYVSTVVLVRITRVDHHALDYLIIVLSVQNVYELYRVAFSFKF